MGNEFSATENFIAIAQRSPSKFTIVGHTTSGGTGNPVWVELPQTKIRVRLSQSRLRNHIDGTVLIEGKGVKPDIEFSFVSAQSFEANVAKQIEVNKTFGVDYPELNLSEFRRQIEETKNEKNK